MSFIDPVYNPSRKQIMRTISESRTKRVTNLLSGALEIYDEMYNLKHAWDSYFKRGIPHPMSKESRRKFDDLSDKLSFIVQRIPKELEGVAFSEDLLEVIRLPAKCYQAEKSHLPYTVSLDGYVLNIHFNGL